MNLKSYCDGSSRRSRTGVHIVAVVVSTDKRRLLQAVQVYILKTSQETTCVWRSIGQRFSPMDPPRLDISTQCQRWSSERTSCCPEAPAGKRPIAAIKTILNVTTSAHGDKFDLMLQHRELLVFTEVALGLMTEVYWSTITVLTLTLANQPMNFKYRTLHPETPQSASHIQRNVYLEYC